jgi:hypothetical protein
LPEALPGGSVRRGFAARFAARACGRRFADRVRTDAARFALLVRRFAVTRARARFAVDFFEPVRRALRRLARLAIWTSFPFRLPLTTTACKRRTETLTVCR